MPVTEQTPQFDPLAKPEKAGLSGPPGGSDTLTEAGRLMTVLSLIHI